MCGIAGYLNFDPEKKAEDAIIRRMTDCIAHRGPDAEGFYMNRNLAFGHRRLSIIDVQTGSQPMFSEDKSLVLIFNGEIYNYLELKAELEVLGHVFRTGSDTEVILKAYREWGIDCQQRFNGMWAFALWDESKQELFLSRDRIGEKPLHYAMHQNTLVFGSEIKSLLAFGLPRVTRPELLEWYLFLTYIPTPHTFYKDIFKLRPGHYLSVRQGVVKEIKYWDLPEINESDMLKDKQRIYSEFGSLFTDAVKLRMRSDVPFGAFLSGGLDSSSVVATMSGMSDFPVETFTMGFQDKAFDESELAALVAKQYSTNHHVNTVSPDLFEVALKKAVFHFDEPFGDSSAIPTGYVSKFAAERVKMVLTGDGGDEVLSGYNSYLGLKVTERYRRLPSVLQRSIPGMLRSAGALVGGSARYKFNKMAGIGETALLPFNDRMIHKMAYTDHATIKKLVAGRSTWSIEDFMSDFYKKYPLKDDFYKLMFFDFKHSLPDDYLVKVDRMSMASSLETRVPFLDHRLVEFMARVDKTVKLEGWKTKTVLRKTIAANLPAALLSAPKKGFGVPLREWFKSDSFAGQFNELKKMDLVDASTLALIIEENKSGKKDNGNFIWTLFMLKEITASRSNEPF